MPPQSPESRQPRTWTADARLVLGLLRPGQKRAGLWLVLFMFVGMALETLGVGILVPALALLTDAESTRQFPILHSLLPRSSGTSRESLVIAGMLAIAAVYIVKAAFLAFLAWRKAGFAYDVQADLSERLFTNYLRQPWSFHLQRNSAQLIRNTFAETSILASKGIIPGMTLVAELLVFTGIAALLLAVEPFGALAVVAILGLAAVGFNRFTRARILRWGKARQYHDGLRIQHLQEGLGGAKDAKLLGREKGFISQFGVHNVASARSGQRWQTMLEFPRLFLEMLGVLGLVGLVILLIARGRGSEAVIPTMGLFAAAAFRLMPSVYRILSSIQSIRYVRPVIDNLHEELAPEGSLSAGVAGNHGPISFKDRLVVDNVAFTYENGDEPAITDISLSIAQGATLGIIGGSGGGKSTLVDVILGLLPPDRGRVSVDGVDIQTALRAWQSMIGYVPQSIFLTDDSLRRNIAFGLPDDEIDDGAVVRALRAAQLEEFVADLPLGVDTVVGERGVRLSGGQRQRIGIARALYHDPVVLVLDEATSSLDHATETGVMEAVRALKGQKTVLIVAHRLSTVAHSDVVLRLENGRLAEQGDASTVLGRIGIG